MKSAAVASALLHGLLLGAVLAHWHWPAPRPVEVPAKIEMVFGADVLNPGAPSNPARAAVPVPPVRVAAVPTPAAGSGVTQPNAPTVPRKPVAATPATLQPVRLGEGLLGFDVPTPDADIVEAQADPGNRPPPPPEAAFARGEHGRVILRIHVRPDGLVGSVETLQSSGYDDLDEVAIGAARRWHFIPQLRDGEAIASVRDQSFDFELR